jgi:type II pantothenate kinase
LPVPTASQSPEASAAPPGRRALGADAGASLVKLAARNASGDLEFASFPAGAVEEAARWIEGFAPDRVGLTGGGAPGLARCLERQAAQIDEFEAWAAGARALLGDAGGASGRFLLVSLGTGTSALRVERDGVQRVGGTALGGGTVLGLCAALTGATSFDEAARLAARGDRRRVDLLVSDIYRDGEPPLPGELNASSFAKLAGASAAQRAAGCDLAHGVMGLVGENVALICCGLAATAQAERIVFGGTTLRGNPALVQILGDTCATLGWQTVFPSRGEYAGALGALEKAAAADSSSALGTASR